jgi:hypothetical protein
MTEFDPDVWSGRPLQESFHQVGTQIEIPQCSGCCRAKMAYQPRTVGDKVMILPTWSGYTDG